MHSVNLDRVPSYYHKYILLVADETVQKALISQQNELNDFLLAIPEITWMHRYAEGKWTIKELVQHITDAERIFSYRALCFSRNEKVALPGFDENEYVIASLADNRTKESILKELRTVQAATLSLFDSLSLEQVEAEGNANGNSIYVKAIGYIIAGHARHHMNIIKERYL